MEIKLKVSTKYTGKYRGVSFEIIKWKIGDEDANAYYLVFPIHQLNETFWLDKKSTVMGRDYFDANIHPIFSQLRGHGDWTLYERIEVNNRRSIRIGCDYQHLFDEGCCCDVDNILFDVKDSIDHLWELKPDLKVWCICNGKWYLKNEGVWTKNGFLSYDGIQQYREWGWNIPDEIVYGISK